MTTTTTGTARPDGQRYGPRLTGEPRKKLAEQVAQLYVDGASIRAIAAETGQSYGFIHRMLTVELGVELRTRGGNRAKPQECQA